MTSRGNTPGSVIVALVMSSFWLSSAAGAHAVDLRPEAERVCLDATCFQRHSDTSGLSLVGVAHFRYWGFRVYSAALYVDIRYGAVTLEQIGFREMELKLTYYREFEPEDFVRSGESLMRENEEISFEAVQYESSRFNELYQPVKPGDTYSIHFRPGAGLSLKLNGRYLGSVEGDLFARAYLGVWLSGTSISKKFTREILDAERVHASVVAPATL